MRGSGVQHVIEPESRYTLAVNLRPEGGFVNSSQICDVLAKGLTGPVPFLVDIRRGLLLISTDILSSSRRSPSSSGGMLNRDELGNIP